ncbi:MAG TPA: SAM-dependent methyltransferase [Acetobacteraceae bacterium]|nr:SAM-dependent methyltransferase [Acetobacteraceae bacterium]
MTGAAAGAGAARGPAAPGERLDRFMARANAAYYATHDPFADFTTAPEIAQAFGEILGLWAAVTWDLLGRPDPVLLVEAGPGRGTLLADALRAIGQVAPGFAGALSLHLIETSPRLRAAQAAALPAGMAARATWHDSLDSVPEAPLLLLANEFLDALPIRQFVRDGGGWGERYVADGSFIIRPAAPGEPAALPAWGASDGPDPTGRPAARDRQARDESDAGADRAEDDGPAGDHDQAAAGILEVCEAAHAFVGALAARLTRHPGAALLLDYGPAAPATGDSLQALRAGRPADPLAAPGEADLTAHVDFPGLARRARAAGVAVHGPLAQGLLLTRLGLFQRTDRLARGQPPARAAGLIAAARRLAEPHRMGRLFKALALCHPDCPTPPGFEP